MRALTTALLTATLLTVACHRGPACERSERDFSDYPVPAELQDMDLPWYCGMVYQSFDEAMSVSYDLNEARVTPAQLREWWPAAFVAAGWTLESSGVSGNGALDAIFTLPDGRSALLTVQPEGTLWVVLVSISAGS